MIRRTVDAAIPGAAAIACWPPVLHIVPLPPSMERYTGDTVTLIWLAVLAISFTLITVGVLVSKRHPAAAFRLEFVPFSFVGSLFAVYVFAVFAAAGPAAWAAGWWTIGIVVYCFARAWELWNALRTAHTARQLDEAAEVLKEIRESKE